MSGLRRKFILPAILSEDYFSEEEMAEMLNISVQRLRDRISSGMNHPPYRKHGRDTIFPKLLYKAWVDRQPLKVAVNG